MNKPHPFKVLNIRIPVIVLVKEGGVINHGSTREWRNVKKSAKYDSGLSV